MGRVCVDRLCYGPSLQWAEFAMGRDVQLPSVTEPTFPCFIKKTQINPEFSNFSVYQGWADFRDQSVVCQDISKLPCIVNNTTDISVLIGIFRNSVKVPCFVNLR